MNKNKHAAKLVFLAMMVALGVVISPILRVEGMCPMAHFINVTCAVMLGPWYAFVCALAIGIIRMTCMGIPPLALTGAVFGAFYQECSTVCPGANWSVPLQARSLEPASLAQSSPILL